MTFRLSLALLAAGAAAAQPAGQQSSFATARALLTKGDVAGAKTAIEATLAAEPRNPEALMFAGNLVRDSYGLLPALPWYDRALQIRPDHKDALFEKAVTLGDAGRATDALATSRELLRLSPNNAYAFYLQAVLAARAGKWELARTLTYRVGHRMDGVPGLLLLRGAVSLEAGANDEAITALRSLLTLKPDNPKAQRLLGLALWRAGDNAGAVEALRLLSEHGDSYALTITGRALEALGNRSAAATALDRAARAGAAMPSPDTLAALDNFLAANPDNAWAQRAAADRALSRGEWDGAAALYASLATRLGNRDPLRLVNAGWAEIGRGDAEAAVALGARAYALAPMSPLATASYGSFLARAGQAAQAVPLLEKAVAMAPDDTRFAQELAAARKSH